MTTPAARVPELPTARARAATPENPTKEQPMTTACICEHCTNPAEYTVRTDRTHHACRACLDTLAARHHWAMTAWTAKRLDALPEFTAVECDIISPDVPMRLIRIYSHPSSWVTTTGVLCTSELLAAMSDGSIRVVSVPVDAPLSDDALRVAHVTEGAL